MAASPYFDRKEDGIPAIHVTPCATGIDEGLLSPPLSTVTPIDSTSLSPTSASVHCSPSSLSSSPKSSLFGQKRFPSFNSLRNASKLIVAQLDKSREKEARKASAHSRDKLSSSSSSAASTSGILYSSSSSSSHLSLPSSPSSYAATPVTYSAKTI